MPWREDYRLAILGRNRRSPCRHERIVWKVLYDGLVDLGNAFLCLPATNRAYPPPGLPDPGPSVLVRGTAPHFFQFEVPKSKMSRQDSVAIVEGLWRDVWQRLQNPHAIDALVAEDFVITLAGKDIVSCEAFKRWVIGFQSKIRFPDHRKLPR